MGDLGLVGVDGDGFTVGLEDLFGFFGGCLGSDFP